MSEETKAPEAKTTEAPATSSPEAQQGAEAHNSWRVDGEQLVCELVHG